MAIDNETMREFYLNVLPDYPSLVLINLRDVDAVGHAPDINDDGIPDFDFDDYISSIRNADRLVNLLWNFIQSDDHYQDKTTLIVTTDHGRDADNYRNHGWPFHSHRHALFLALGPDIQSGEDIFSLHFINGFLILTSAISNISG